MFTPVELELERGWPGRIEDDHVVQFAAQTLEAFFTGGGSAREHAVFELEGVALRAPVLRPPAIRLFEDPTSFEFANTASVYGPEDPVPAPAEAEPRFSVAAVIGANEQLAGYTLVNDWRAPSLQPPKDRDFAISIGPWVETEYEPEFDFEAARALAARNTHLRSGDILVAPPLAVGGGGATVGALGTLLAREQRDQR
jgi:hypothetical protein